MKYLKVANELSAEQISSLMWSLTRPDKTEKDTQYYIGWTTHPETGEVVLGFPTLDYQPIHENSDTAILEFAEAISSVILPEEKTELINLLISSKGQKIITIDIIPQSLKDKLLTFEEVSALGFFGTIENSEI